MKTDLRCPNCGKKADFAIKEMTPGKTAKAIAAHKAEKGRVWLRNTLLSKTHQRRLLKALGEVCSAGARVEAGE